MDTVIGYESASGALMKVRTDSYTGQVADYLSTLTDDPAQAVALAKETMNRSAPAERITPDTTSLSHSFLVYARFSLYPLMTFAIVTISTLMTALGRRAIRSRLDSAPVSSRSRNLGLLGAGLVVGAVGWVWVLGLGITAFEAGTVTTSAPLLGVVAAALGAYMLVAVSIGFLMGQLGLSQNAANAVANIGGLAMSFLAGAWVPIEWLPDAVARAARLTPATGRTRRSPGPTMRPRCPPASFAPCSWTAGSAPCSPSRSSRWPWPWAAPVRGHRCKARVTSPWASWSSSVL